MLVCLHPLVFCYSLLLKYPFDLDMDVMVMEFVQNYASNFLELL